jgi:hypothetical protein
MKPSGFGAYLQLELLLFAVELRPLAAALQVEHLFCPLHGAFIM